MPDTGPVPRTPSTAQAERDLVRHCHSGLDTAALQQQVLRSLRRLMPVDAGFFSVADPETLLLAGGYAEEPLASSTRQFLANEYGGDDVNRFADLARSAPHVASLDAATRRDRHVSGRYTDIMRPLGLGDELRAALVTGSECWGYLCLHRADDPRGFTGREAALLARLGPHIAHGLRQATLLHPAAAPGTALRPGVVLLDDDLTLVAATPDAEGHLSLIDGITGSRPLPAVVYSVAAALRAIEHATGPGPVQPSARIHTRDGRWLDVHASRLQGPPGEDRIAVVLEPAHPHTTTQLMLSAHGLTSREVDVARQVLRGDPTRNISAALHISAHTVQDHLKAVFDKTGVRSRGELVALLLVPRR